MYIPEFWCGAIATILIEFSAIIAYSFYFNVRKKEKDQE